MNLNGGKDVDCVVRWGIFIRSTACSIIQQHHLITGERQTGQAVVQRSAPDLNPDVGANPETKN